MSGINNYNNLPSKIGPFVVHFLKKRKWLFTLLVICSLAPTVDSFLWPYLTGSIVDAVKAYSGPGDDLWGMVKHLLLIGLLLWILIEAMFRGIGFSLALLLPKLSAEIRMSMFQRAVRHSHSYFANNLSGAISNRVNEMSLMVERIIKDLIVDIMPSICTAIVFVIYFSTLYWAISLSVLVWVITHCMLVFYGAIVATKDSEQHSLVRTQLIGKIVDVFSNIGNVRSYSRIDYENDFISKVQNQEIVKRSKLLFNIEYNKLMLGVNCFFFLGICLTTSQYFAFKYEYITLGELIISIQGTGGLLMAIWYMGAAIPELFSNIGICNQSLEIITTPLEVVDDKSAQDLNVNDGIIEFKDVVFAYRGGVPLFSNLNVKIKAKQKVGLVGYSGSGKTTFANLILRYFDINSGQILIDGQNIAKVRQQSLRENIAIIPQEALLFHRTIMENIRYGKIDATDEEVIEAAKKAQCHDFIIKMPQGYETLGGEKGVKLSGGQRQRIIIARAILKDAPIVILDEATSALDSSTERLIHDAINEATRDKTTLIIAHRLSTLADVDRIIVFDHGTIVEDGSHEQLLAQNGKYRELWEMQNDGFLPDS